MSLKILYEHNKDNSSINYVNKNDNPVYVSERLFFSIGELAKTLSSVELDGGQIKGLSLKGEEIDRTEQIEEQLKCIATWFTFTILEADLTNDKLNDVLDSDLSMKSGVFRLSQSRSSLSNIANLSASIYNKATHSQIITAGELSSFARLFGYLCSSFMLESGKVYMNAKGETE